MSVELARRRRLAVLGLIPAGILAIVGLWWFEASHDLLADYDRVGYPAVLVALVAAVVLLLQRAPRAHRMGEYLAFTSMSIYIVAAVQYFAFVPGPNSLYSIANTLQWVPVLYVGAFAFFSTRVSVIGGIGLFVLSGAAPAWAALTGHAPWSVEVGALIANAFGAHALVLLCVSMILALRRQIAQVSEHARLMEDAANTDSLTGTRNRRGMQQLMQARSESGLLPCGLLLFDLDHFKQVNDRFGHRTGDEVLASTAQLIRSQLRVGDHICRWGGEEFLVLATATDAQGAVDLAERVRRIVEAAAHPLAGRSTVSAGVSVCLPGQSMDAALERADRALYLAKDNGRNRVATLDPLE